MDPHAIAGSIVTELGLRHKQSGTVSHSAFTRLSPADVLSVLAATPEGAKAVAGTTKGLHTVVLNGVGINQWPDVCFLHYPCFVLDMPAQP